MHPVLKPARRRGASRTTCSTGRERDQGAPQAVRRAARPGADGAQGGEEAERCAPRSRKDAPLAGPAILGRHRRRAGRRARHPRALHVPRGRRRLQQPAVRPRAHAGARRGRARQAETSALREFTEARLPRVEQQLERRLPVYPEFEMLRLSSASSACANGWARMTRWCARCSARIRRTRWRDAPGDRTARSRTPPRAWRCTRAARPRSTRPGSDDRLAAAVDPDARALRKQLRERSRDRCSAAGAIAQARFAAYGTSIYPDATFTLRLNYGTVKGWNEKGKPVGRGPSSRVPSSARPARRRSSIPERWLR